MRRGSTRPGWVELLTPGDGDPFAGIAAPPDLIGAARDRLEAEQSEQIAKLAKLDHQVAEKRAEEAQIEAEIAKIDASLPLIRKRAAIRAEALKSGYGNKIDLLDETQQVVEEEHERIALQRKHDEADAALAELAAQTKQAEAEFRRKCTDRSGESRS